LRRLAIAVFRPDCRSSRFSIRCYATQIARDWNVRESGAGFVTRFKVDAMFAQHYPVQTVGSSIHQELWVPAQELPQFNAHLVGTIEVIGEFSR
jgi:hypothetical protein